MTTEPWFPPQLFLFKIHIKDIKKKIPGKLTVKLYNPQVMNQQRNED